MVLCGALLCPCQVPTLLPLGQFVNGLLPMQVRLRSSCPRSPRCAWGTRCTGRRRSWASPPRWRCSRPSLRQLPRSRPPLRAGPGAQTRPQQPGPGRGLSSRAAAAEGPRPCMQLCLKARAQHQGRMPRLFLRSRPRRRRRSRQANAGSEGAGSTSRRMQRQPGWMVRMGEALPCRRRKQRGPCLLVLLLRRSPGVSSRQPVMPQMRGGKARLRRQQVTGRTRAGGRVLVYKTGVGVTAAHRRLPEKSRTGSAQSGPCGGTRLPQLQASRTPPAGAHHPQRRRRAVGKHVRLPGAGRAPAWSGRRALLLQRAGSSRAWAGL